MSRPAGMAAVAVALIVALAAAAAAPSTATGAVALSTRLPIVVIDAEGPIVDEPTAPLARPAATPAAPGSSSWS